MWKQLKSVVLISFASLALLGAIGYWYVQGFALAESPKVDKQSSVSDLAFVRDGVRAPRGRILAVLTSTALIGTSGKKAGFELTELSRAYYVFIANGYQVDIASPLGGKPPMNLDDGLVAADYAFLNDANAQQKLLNSAPLARVEPADYAAVYFVGGKGTMFDFADNLDIQRTVREVYERGGVIGAVCHGPAALLNVRLSDGRSLIAGKRITGFTNAEELFLLKDARTLFPYLLQDRAIEQGAQFIEGPLYLDNTIVDGRLITGQNPWSTWSVAEAMVSALGHKPVAREPTSEELSVGILHRYYRDGAAAAAEQANAQASRMDRRMLLMHAVVAAMQYRWRDTYHFQRLARP